MDLNCREINSFDEWASDEHLIILSWDRNTYFSYWTFCEAISLTIQAGNQVNDFSLNNGKINLTIKTYENNNNVYLITAYYPAKPVELLFDYTQQPTIFLSNAGDKGEGRPLNEQLPL